MFSGTAAYTWNSAVHRAPAFTSIGSGCPRTLWARRSACVTTLRDAVNPIYRRTSRGLIRQKADLGRIAMRVSTFSASRWRRCFFALILAAASFRTGPSAARQAVGDLSLMRPDTAPHHSAARFRGCDATGNGVSTPPVSHDLAYTSALMTSMPTKVSSPSTQASCPGGMV